MNKPAEIQPGTHFQQALSVIDESSEEHEAMTENTTNILRTIVDKYETTVGTGYVGVDGVGEVTDNTNVAPVGLLYGRIQSGKTRAMILTAALALDNHFRIAVILTSNINRLVGQTHQDFIDGMPTVQIYSKADLKGNGLTTEAAHIARALEDKDFGVVIVGSKGPQVLQQLTEFLTKIGAEKYPTIIFDDEGDQATLDTNTGKRSKSDPEAPPSTIHSLVHSSESVSLRKVMPYGVFVSVTGTPQGIFLQNTDSRSRLSFVHLLEAGEQYVGGKVFFGESSPADVPYIRLVDENENIKLHEDESLVPEGLQAAVCFFIVSATAIGITTGKWQEYKMLCHTSVKQSDHSAVKDLVDGFVSNIIGALRAPNDVANALIITQLRKAYDELLLTCTDAPSFDDILKEAKTRILHRKLFTVNAKSTNDEMRYSKSYNFLIGGNTVGRGLAIKKLLVTYYTRLPKNSMADTMYQHARMFGYRKDTLAYTRVFLSRTLYRRFREIYKGDEDARKYIEQNGFDEKGALLLKTVMPGVGLRPTRPNVLDADKVKVLYPGRAIYPNYPVYKKDEADKVTAAVNKIMKQVAPEFLTSPKNSKKISLEDAQRLAKALKTHATNSWSDKHVSSYLKTFAQQLGDDTVMLEWRESDRKADDTVGGYIDNGVHFGGKNGELNRWQKAKEPTLFIAKMKGAKLSKWDDTSFYYPTIVGPESLNPYIFNKS
ncbi:MAG: hypothetical protein JWN28_273 [Candidatus Saccharibacteria bacterium]|nr:hypothetical protein [Candidatus Saccharibacteria bacterium]